MQDGSRIAQLIEASRAGLQRDEPSATGQVLDALTVHLADLPDDVLADMVRAAASLAGWAAGVQARAAGELVLRSRGFTGFEQTTTMVSGELRETRRTARVITVRAAAGLRHPVVIDHLSAGRIDAPRADALLLAGRSLTDQQRAGAIEDLLPTASERSAAWLANEMRKLARSLDPGKESKAAAESRAVFHDACEDGMGTVTAFLPAVDSAAVWGVLDDLAQQIRRTDDTRTLGQLRADVLTSIVTGRLVPQNRDPHDDTERDREPVVRLTPSRPVVRVTVPLTALRGDDADPHPDTASDRGGAAWLDGFGPLDVGTATRVAFDPDSTWYRLVTDPVTGVLTDYSTRAYRPPQPLADAVRLRDGTCRGPGCQIDARWCDLDHIDPYDRERASDPSEPGQTRADNLHALCRTHHRLKTKYGWHVHRDPASGITYWTAPTGRRYTKSPTSIDPEPTSFREFLRARTALPDRGAELTDRGPAAGPHEAEHRHHDGEKDRRTRGVDGNHVDAPDEPPF